jgi:hypothetical protein
MIGPVGIPRITQAALKLHKSSFVIGGEAVV